MAELDEVSQSIGKIQGTLEAHGLVHGQILKKLDSLEDSLASRIRAHDDHIDELKKEMNERRGAARVWAAVAGIAGAGSVKILEKLF